MDRIMTKRLYYFSEAFWMEDFHEYGRNTTFVVQPNELPIGILRSVSYGCTIQGEGSMNGGCSFNDETRWWSVRWP